MFSYRDRADGNRVYSFWVEDYGPYFLHITKQAGKYRADLSYGADYTKGSKAPARVVLKKAKERLQHFAHEKGISLADYVFPAIDCKRQALFERMRKNNPPSRHWPVMSYAAAHRYEPMAKAKNVSAVARSGRGFMRAYERAGSWAALDQWWKDRRDNFVSRHMAQVRQRGEKLWKNGHPSRRALALLMWAYMPPGKNPALHGKGFRLPTRSFNKKQILMGLKVEMEHTRRKDVALRIVKDHLSEDPLYYSKLKRAGLADELRNPLYRTGRQLLFSSEMPEGRSNTVRYFLKGHHLPWRGGRQGFGPEWEEVFKRSDKQARALMAQRNPRVKTKVVRVRCGKKTLEVRLYKRSR